eukprot:scaffold20793_cov22-Tisochrysis_lutea.AAC.1
MDMSRVSKSLTAPGGTGISTGDPPACGAAPSMPPAAVGALPAAFVPPPAAVGAAAAVDAAGTALLAAS